MLLLMLILIFFICCCIVGSIQVINHTNHLNTKCLCLVAILFLELFLCILIDQHLDLDYSNRRKAGTLYSIILYCFVFQIRFISYITP